MDPWTSYLEKSPSLLVGTATPSGALCSHIQPFLQARSSGLDRAADRDTAPGPGPGYDEFSNAPPQPKRPVLSLHMAPTVPDSQSTSGFIALPGVLQNPKSTLFAPTLLAL